MEDKSKLSKEKGADEKDHSRECSSTVDECGCFDIVDACGCRVVDPCGCYTECCCC